MDQIVQPMIEGLIDALGKDGPILRSVAGVSDSLRAHVPLVTDSGAACRRRCSTPRPPSR